MSNGQREPPVSRRTRVGSSSTAPKPATWKAFWRRTNRTLSKKLRLIRTDAMTAENIIESVQGSSSAVAAET